MRIIISPAKKMNLELDSLPPTTTPHFLGEAQQLLDQLSNLTYTEAKALWKCSDKIAQPNFQRLATLQLNKAQTPAILAYEGIQYRYMAPSVFDTQQFEYIDTHLRVLSGFYGLLRPFDGVVPYRLEMAAKLAGQGYRSLYQFWGNRLANKLAEECSWIVNLASKEYSDAVLPHLPPDILHTTCVFGEHIGGKIVEKATLCKMARGEMVRYMAEHKVKTIERLQRFDRLGYRFSQEHSQQDRLVFIKGGN